MASRAYQQWLKNKQLEDEGRRKEQIIQREIKNIQEEERRAHQERAKANFASWKKRKDFERTLTEHNREGTSSEVDHVGHIEPTPALPGYCSVWSCDEELAGQMLTRVHRPS